MNPPQLSIMFFLIHALVRSKCRDVVFCSQVVGAVHLAVQIPSIMYALYYGTTLAHMCPFSTAYFIYDIVVCIVYFRKMGAAYLGHALAAGSVFNYMSIYGHVQWAPKLLVWELSTPCVYIRAAMQKLSYRREPWYTANNLALMVTFFFSRIVWSVFIFRDAWLQYSDVDTYGYIPMAIIIGPGAILNSLNLYWFWKMIKMAYRTIKKRTN